MAGPSVRSEALLFRREQWQREEYAREGYHGHSTLRSPHYIVKKDTKIQPRAAQAVSEKQ